MMKVNFAKSIMEQEEGMNHVWIQVAPLGDVTHASIQVILPPGVYRTANISGFYEEASGRIRLEHPEVNNELLIELYTQEAAGCGAVELTFMVSYKDGGRERHSYSLAASLMLVDEEGMVGVVTDQAVVSRVKEAEQHRNTPQHQSYTVHPPLPVISFDPHYSSELEKKYRVEGVSGVSERYSSAFGEFKANFSL